MLVLFSNHWIYLYKILVGFYINIGRFKRDEFHFWLFYMFISLMLTSREKKKKPEKVSLLTKSIITWGFVPIFIEETY